MELEITEKNATICLNMIIKNESHIIANTLENLCNKIKFDYWLICDTGSTDNTVQIITDFFKKKGINGEIFYDEWVNFAHNRTLALQRAYRKTQLLLVFDADDEIFGNITIPKDVLFDQYYLKFGSSQGTVYSRVLLINNYKEFEYLSVIHEFISCKEEPVSSTTIDGDYYVVSGRTGSRNLDPDKYLKDALILEKAYIEAKKKNDHLFHRYSYYCANSYKDCGKFEDAIKWYKITLNHPNQWNQEKYTSCLYIYDCYKALNQEFNSFFYLVKSFAYDTERVECLYPLLVHYCCENMYKVAYNYYLNVKNFFENHYINTDISQKLFIINDKYNFFVPYYMILIADKVQDFKCVIRMYEIVFIKKQRMFDEWHIKNFLYNLQFFIQHVLPDNKKPFISLANDYIDFLHKNGVNFESFDFLNKDVYRNAGINVDKYIIKTLTYKEQKFSKEKCASSKNILFYTGFSDIDWNYSYMLNNALGGSEKAVAYITKCFPKDYNIFISGHVKNETFDNITYIHLNELTNLIDSVPFHTVIVSRYIAFYEMFPTCSFFKSFIWAHDVSLLPYGCELTESQIIQKWNCYITGCVCLTKWHKELFIEKYSKLKDKITLINNGLDIDSFKKIDNTILKIKNKFIYSSRPERGLDTLLYLWPQILEKMPDATLSIATYGNFPTNSQEKLLKSIIDNHHSIHYLGKLNPIQLYEEMRSSEYWLYPTNWPETSCITALEMLMSEVICVYYPVAGLPNTIDKYGIQISPGKEIETIVSLTEEDKNQLRENGKKYTETCSWINRAKQWTNVLSIKESSNTKNIAIFNSFPFHYEMFGYIIDYSKKNSMELTIFTNFENNLGWLEFYKNIFHNYNFEYKNITDYDNLKNTFDITFVTTDDDYSFKTEWINDKCISIEHSHIIRRGEFKYKIATRPFITNYRDWVLPCYELFNKSDKTNFQESDINIAIIGGLDTYNYDTVNRLHSDKNINLFVICRTAFNFDIREIKNNIKITLHNNLLTTELFILLQKCDFILTDITYNTHHINGISMSGSIPISFSSLTPLIISKFNNNVYKFKNVIEFDIDSKNNINIDKGMIDISSLFEERERLSSMLNSYLISNKFLPNNINTALIIDPRNDDNLPSLIHDFQEKLGDNWKIVFYCGKNLKNKMELLLDKRVEVRELNIINFDSLNKYSDFMKQRDLWSSLYGEFVLTFQLDTYIFNKSPYNINYFVSMNKSYIGGNMDHDWLELNREKIYDNYRNFNGGLSLRKRIDMIKIIDTFGIETTEYNSNKIQTDSEDIYFTLGCYKLELPLGNNKECMHFCCNRIYVNNMFGVHKPIPELLQKFEEISKIYDISRNRFILQDKNRNINKNKIIDCFTFYNELNMYKN